MSGILCADDERLCIRARGADAAKYLHSQLSNDIESLPVGHSRYAFALEPTGKVVALVRVTRLAESEFLLDTDARPGLEEILLARLNKFKIRVDIEFSAEICRCIAIRSDDDEPISTQDRESLAAIASTSSAIVVDAMWHDGRALDVIASESDLDARQVCEFLPGSRMTAMPDADLEIARVRMGWPAMITEIEPGESVPASTGVVARAVSFTKGCYPGQELVERMDSRGSSAPRSLRRFRLEDLVGVGNAPVSSGDPITVDGREVGTVTSVAGQWALAFVQRGVEVGQPVSSAD